MAKRNILPLWQVGLDERNRFLDEAQLIAELTISSTEPKPSGNYSTNANNNFSSAPRKIKRPKSNAGASAVKGLVATVIATNAPPNVRFFRLVSDPVIPIEDSKKKELETPFSKYESQIERFLARYNFGAFQHAALERLFIEGNIVVKIDKNNGFMLYPLRQINIVRNWGKVCRIMLEEYFYEHDEASDKPKRICQYILIDKEKDEVWVQRQDETSARKSSDKAEAYFVVTSEIPTIDNYARSYYSDHYGLLKSIDDGATALLEAQKICSWNWLSFTGPTTIPTSTIANIKPMQVFRTTSHDNVKWQTAGQKINDWQFVWQKLQADENRLLMLSAVGLYQRASQANTATEVLAIKQELDSLIGSASQIVSQTFYHQIIDSLLDVLGIRQDFGMAVAAQTMDVSGNLPEDILNSKLIEVVPTTGAPALAREQDLARLYQSLNELAKIIGPQGVLQYLNVSGLMKETFDGLRVNTEGIINQQPQTTPQDVLQSTTAAEAQALGPDVLRKIIAQSQNQGVNPNG